MCLSNRPKPLEDNNFYPRHMEVGPDLSSESWNWCLAPFSGKAHVSGKALDRHCFLARETTLTGWGGSSLQREYLNSIPLGTKDNGTVSVGCKMKKFDALCLELVGMEKDHNTRVCGYRLIHVNLSSLPVLHSW